MKEKSKTEKTSVDEKTEKNVKAPETVAVRDYVTSRGYSGIVNWDGESPTVAGVKLKPYEIKDGTAYVAKTDVDSVLDNMERKAGITDAQKMRDQKYKSAEDSAFTAMTDRKPFSYDPQNDQAYEAYKKQYERSAENALRRILNDNNTSITGASGAVLSDAMAAYTAQSDKMTDIIPELYEAAYKRYSDESARLTSDFKTVNSAANDYYDRMSAENNNVSKRISDSGKAERDERQRITENARNAENDMYENALKQIEILYREDEIKSDITKSDTGSEKTAMYNAAVRGFFVQSDEEAIPWLKNFRTASGGYSISPSVASAAYEYEKAHAKEKAKINAKLGL